METLRTFIRKVNYYGVIRSIQFVWAETVENFYKQKIFHMYSQFGEDLLLDSFFHHKTKGFYVDVGAYDPFRFSNTMRFYERGWRGINIEPNVEQWKKFKQYRPKDRNLNIGIGKRPSILKFYVMDPPTLSTFFHKQAIAFEHKGFKIHKIVNVKLYTLKNILEKYLKNGKIDFLSIDVEGQELEVLESNDWRKFRPMYICVELKNPNSSSGSDDNPIQKYLNTIGYEWITDIKDNSFFKDKKVS